MPAVLSELYGLRILTHSADGTLLRSARDATDLIADAAAHRADLTIIPVERLGDDFFRLRTGVAGENSREICY